jgi:hypothetical protein
VSSIAKTTDDWRNIARRLVRRIAGSTTRSIAIGDVLIALRNRGFLLVREEGSAIATPMSPSFTTSCTEMLG